MALAPQLGALKSRLELRFKIFFKNLLPSMLRNNRLLKRCNMGRSASAKGLWVSSPPFLPSPSAPALSAAQSFPDHQVRSCSSFLSSENKPHSAERDSSFSGHEIQILLLCLFFCWACRRWCFWRSLVSPTAWESCTGKIFHQQAKVLYQKCLSLFSAAITEYLSPGDLLMINK